MEAATMGQEDRQLGRLEAIVESLHTEMMRLRDFRHEAGVKLQAFADAGQRLDELYRKFDGWIDKVDARFIEMERRIQRHEDKIAAELKAHEDRMAGLNLTDEQQAAFRRGSSSTFSVANALTAWIALIVAMWATFFGGKAN